MVSEVNFEERSFTFVSPLVLSAQSSRTRVKNYCSTFLSIDRILPVSPRYADLLSPRSALRDKPFGEVPKASLRLRPAFGRPTGQ